VSEGVGDEAMQREAKLKRETMDEDIMAQKVECSALKNRVCKNRIRVIMQMQKNEKSRTPQDTAGPIPPLE
jgi:hypothetical protein